MSENLKRAESLFNRIMNNGKDSTPFKPSTKKPEKLESHRDNNHGSHNSHNNHHNNHNHGNGHNNYRNKHKYDLINHEALKIPEKVLLEVSDVQNQHILPYCWTIWYHYRPINRKRLNLADDKNKYLRMTREVEFPKFNNPEETTKHFATIEQMWLNLSILGQPKDVPVGTEYLIFKSGINPAWEDPFNTKGGRWIFKFRRANEENSEVEAEDEVMVRRRTSLIWERLLLRILTGSIIPTDEHDEETVDILLNDINGIVLSIRKDEDTICIWNSNLHTKNRKNPSVPTRKILCDSILRVIRECDLILAGQDPVTTKCSNESTNERVKSVSFEYRLHSDYNSNYDSKHKRFNNTHHSLNQSLESNKASIE